MGFKLDVFICPDLLCLTEEGEVFVNRSSAEERWSDSQGCFKHVDSRVSRSLLLQAFHCFHHINDHVSTNISTFFPDISPFLAETVAFSLCCSTVVVSSEAEHELIDLLCLAHGMSFM